jgi:cytochrome P450
VLTEQEAEVEVDRRAPHALGIARRAMGRALLSVRRRTGTRRLLDAASSDFKAGSPELYERLRREAPVCPVHLPGARRRVWLVTRYADAEAVLKDPARFVKDIRAAQPDRGGRSAQLPSWALRINLANMLYRDRQVHARARALVKQAFTPRNVEARRPRIEEVAAELLDRVEPRGGADLIGEFALPLTLTTICEIMGVPDEGRGLIPRCSTAINTLRPGNPAFRRAVEDFVDYVEGLLEQRRREPRDDLLSVLLGAAAGADPLAQEDVIGMAVFLLIAGHETTMGAIGSSVLALLEHPAELVRLRADPALVPGAVDEFLRYESPAEWATARWAAEDVEVGGTRIPRGDRVHVVLGSANRDAEAFPEPDRLELGREDCRHLAFGLGSHFCLGAPLARLEIEVAIGLVLSRLDGLRLAVPREALRWRPATILRGLEALPVAWDVPAGPPGGGSR